MIVYYLHFSSSGGRFSAVGKQNTVLPYLCLRVMPGHKQSIPAPLARMLAQHQICLSNLFS